MDMKPEAPGVTIHPSDEAFFASLSKEDDLGVVIRAHIHVEAILQELIELAVARPADLPSLNLRFEQRVGLAVMLGVLDDRDGPALRVLGGLRNAFAHRTGTELSAERVNQLYGVLSEVVREVLRKTYQKVPHPGAPELDRAAPKIRFVTIVMSLRGMLLYVIENVRKMRANNADA